MHWGARVNRTSLSWLVLMPMIGLAIIPTSWYIWRQERLGKVITLGALLDGTMFHGGEVNQKTARCCCAL